MQWRGRCRIGLMAMACLAMAGCGGVAVRVSDGETGAPIREARITGTGADAVTGSAGRATVPAAPDDAEISVRADGYRPWMGARSEVMMADGSLSVALAPAWLDAFMDGRAHPRGQVDPDGTPQPCHCHGRGR